MLIYRRETKTLIGQEEEKHFRGGSLQQDEARTGAGERFSRLLKERVQRVEGNERKKAPQEGQHMEPALSWDGNMGRGKEIIRKRTFSSEGGVMP